MERRGFLKLFASGIAVSVVVANNPIRVFKPVVECDKEFSIKKGDIFTISGVYAVNPITKTKEQELKQFTVTDYYQSVISTNSGAESLDINIK